MRKQWICAAVLAASAACASAQTTWQFTYQGFIDGTTGEFLPEQRLTGTFAGSDADADGIIARDELTYLSAGGQVYLGEFGGGCVHSDSPYLQCSIGRFSYALTGNLAFAVSYSGHDEFSGGWYGGVTTGVDYGYGGYRDLDSWEQSYEWTDRTTFAIAPAPVPEPSAMLLLPAGLVVLARAGRQRAKALAATRS